MAVHILGVSNILTDSLSRGVLLSPSKWSLSARITQTIVLKLRIYHMIDLSAIWASKPLSWLVILKSIWLVILKSILLQILGSQGAIRAINALSIPWTDRMAYAFLPISLLFKVIEKIHRKRCVAILIAPFWPNQPWFSNVEGVIDTQTITVTHDTGGTEVSGSSESTIS